MTVIVNTGSTLTVTIGTGLTLTSASTVAAGGLLDGAGTIVGNFTLLNLGTISADVAAGVLSVNTGTLTNQGTIVANDGSLIVQASVVDTNLSGSTLTGGVWDVVGTGAIELLSDQIITDNATITLNGTAATLDGFNAGTLQSIDKSLTTIGTSGVLNLLGGRNFQASTSLTIAGDVTLGGGTLAAPGGITIAATGDVTGFGIIDPGTPLQVDGTIEAKSGTLALPGASGVTGTGVLQVDAGASLALQAFGSYAQGIVNNGTIDAVAIGFSGTLGFSGPYSGTGGFLIEGGFDGTDRAILELSSSVSGHVTFDSNFGELLLDSPTSFNGPISGFGDNDRLVLSTVANAQTATLSGNVLSLKNGGGTVVQTLTIDAGSMDYSAATFGVSENLGNNIATVTVSGAQAAACFAGGTMIRTVKGEVAVECLTVGDILRAHFAGTAPVVWLGHRHVNCRLHPEPSKMWPVLVSAHAFGPRMPSRDLLLSPDHAVFVDGVLIPIKHLINGETIVQRQVDEITYYHVELGEHDVLLADGMPAESYLENGDRIAFDNAGGLVALHPSFGGRRWEAFGCAPMVVTGRKLEAAIERTLARIPKRRRAVHRNSVRQAA